MNPVAEILAEEIVDRARKMRAELKILQLDTYAGRTEAEYLLLIAAKVIKAIKVYEVNIGCTSDEIRDEVRKIIC